MNDIPTALRSLARQEQFLDVVDRDTATARFHRHLKLRPLGAETVPLSQALGRVLARAVIADVDVPGFDRASVDGFAVRADDTVGASERTPKALALNGEILTPRHGAAAFCRTRYRDVDCDRRDGAARGRRRRHGREHRNAG